MNGLRFPSTLFVFVCSLVVTNGLQTLRVQGGEPEEAAVRFNRDIKPILSDRCWACHGPDPETREAGLQLDTFAGATEDLGGYAAIVPGDAEASELIRRISAEDEYEVMPPPSHGQRLTPEEIELMTRWIESGGEYAKHWSYVPPQKPAVPPMSGNCFADADTNAIDRFVARQLVKAGLTSSPPADRYTLIRRLALDLTGLPPTPEEADAFVNDDSPDAYQRVVDRYLAEPAFAERWTAVWLDLARYADSAGYADDPPRTIWAYRDYVIKAFARAKPFDQFTIEQIAGDMLPNSTPEQRIASAFHRNTMTNSEGGTDDEEFRSAAIVDRVNTTMAVWMGTTMACAQCHTHKYDPITQEEYFRVYAIFNNTADADRRDENPTVPVYSPAQRRQRNELQAKIAQLESELASSSLPRTDEQIAWEEQTIASLDETPLARFVRVELPEKQQFLSLAEVQVFSGEENVALGGKATQSSTAYAGPAELAIDGNTNGAFHDSMSVTHTENETNPWWQVDLGKSLPINSVVVWNRTDNNLQSRLDGFQVTLLDEQNKVLFRDVTAKAPPREQKIEVGGLPPEVSSSLQRPHDQRSDEEAKQLGRYFRQQQLTSLNQQLANIKPQSTVPVMEELTENRRETFIQIRGNFRSLDRKVTEGVPSVFHDLPEDQEPNRFGLARWLVADENPLTARVTVNRFWEKIFGVGLVKTSEEFGSQGEMPSHPELLDWLATEFVDNGWDQKHILRKIVMSATYRQQSNATEERLQRDPFNQWLSRGPRTRLGAETIRDQALFVSGLLSHEMFGPSVQPPRPTLNLNAAFGGSTDWKNSTGADRYRRGIYTEWRRSMPYPSMATFDAPSREVCTLDRGRTNTPLQALVTLNDPVFVEAAQALARRSFRELDEVTDGERLTWAFRRVLLRPPLAEEVDALQSLLDKMRQRYSEQPEEATKLATDPLGPVPPEFGVPVTELAAWTVVGNVLLNLDETLQPK